MQQIICTIKIRRAPTRHDTIDFQPLITKISELVPLSVVTADKGYDSEDNQVLVRDVLHALSVIPPRYEHVPIRKTHGRYRKQMKRGYSKLQVMCDTYRAIHSQSCVECDRSNVKKWEIISYK